MAHRTTALHHVGNKYVEPDPAIGRPGTYLAAADLNSLQEELANAIEDAGVALDPLDDGQLAAVLAADRAARVGGDAALDTRLDALEAAPADGKAGIVWGPNWAESGTDTYLKKQSNGVVLVMLHGIHSGATGDYAVATLPEGYRPAQPVPMSAINSTDSAAAIATVNGAGVVNLLGTPAITNKQFLIAATFLAG